MECGFLALPVRQADSPAAKAGLKPDDLIVPALPNVEDREKEKVHSRNANHMLRRFHQDRKGRLWIGSGQGGSPV